MKRFNKKSLRRHVRTSTGTAFGWLENGKKFWNFLLFWSFEKAITMTKINLNEKLNFVGFAVAIHKFTFTSKVLLITQNLGSDSSYGRFEHHNKEKKVKYAMANLPDRNDLLREVLSPMTHSQCSWNPKRLFLRSSSPRNEVFMRKVFFLSRGDQRE